MLDVLKLVSGNLSGRMIRMISISVLEAIFGAIPFVVLYFVLCDVIDHTLTLSKFTDYIIIISVSVVIRMVFTYLSITLSRADGTTMIMDLRMRLGEHVRKLPLGFFSSNNIGTLSNGILENVNRVETILSMLMPEFISTLALSLLVSLGLFYIDARMAITTLMTMPLAFALLVWVKQIMHVRGKALYQSSSQLTNSIIEYVSGIKFIKSFNSSDKKFDDLVDRMEDFKDKSLRTEGVLSPIMVLSNISIDFGLVALLFLGSHFMIGGSLDPKVFIVYIIMSSRFYENLKSLSTNYVKIRYMLIAGQKIGELFQVETLSGEDKTLDYGDKEIVFRDVSFGYGKETVLKGINTIIPHASMTAIVGPSGSGKSTMANLIARFYDVEQGGIFVGDKNLKNVDPEVILTNVSMVFQRVTLFRDTVYNNIAMGNLNASEAEVIEAAQRANCHEFISRLTDGYNTIVDEKGGNLSGGEQLRISIARAMLKDAPVVLLDEVTSSLDPENEHFIQKSILDLIKNKTVVVIAHRLKTIKNADKIIVLNHGEIVESGKHQDLLEQQGLYHKMWETQNHAIGWKIAN